MLRRLLNIASVVCLVLCMVLMGMWVWSHSWIYFVLPSRQRDIGPEQWVRP